MLLYKTDNLKASHLSGFQFYHKIVSFNLITLALLYMFLWKGFFFFSYKSKSVLTNVYDHLNSK